MNITDPIADLLTRIRNASQAAPNMRRKSKKHAPIFSFMTTSPLLCRSWRRFDTLIIAQPNALVKGDVRNQAIVHAPRCLRRKELSKKGIAIH